MIQVVNRRSNSVDMNRRAIQIHSKSTTHIASVLIFSFVAIAFGCSHYSTSSRSLPSHIRTIAIPLFQNATVENGIIEPLTDAIVSKFVTDNQLKVVDSRDADSIISGTVVTVREESVSFEQDVDTRETRLWIVASVRYEDVRQNSVIWEDLDMRAWGVFEIASGTTEDRNEGVEQAVARMADDILNKTVASW
ncbi:MAG: hypothetical protein HOH43_28385 [Candidatus Latescibacteria bacterium]|nr:hypothetical protein [Candidatus Latescibacterota bacterium]